MDSSSKRIVKTNLYSSPAPLEWAVVSHPSTSTLYTAQIPIDEKGAVVEGGIEPQTKQMFENLIHTLSSAKITTDDVLQVLIYVTDRSYLKTVNTIYSQYFKNKPYPNRAAVVVAGLAREEMLVEIVVYAQIHNN